MFLLRSRETEGMNEHLCVQLVQHQLAEFIQTAKTRKF